MPELNLSKAHMLGKLFSSSVVKQGAKPDTTVSSSGFLTLYDREFAGPLRGRSASYRIMFEKLQARARSLDRPLLIVETGSLRVLGNWDDGQSTLLWDEFSRFHPAEIHTVDLDPQAAVVVQDACGPAVRAHTGDSVMFLHQFRRQSATPDRPPLPGLLRLRRPGPVSLGHAPRQGTDQHPPLPGPGHDRGD